VNQDSELEFVIWPNISFAMGCVQFCEESSHRIMISGESGTLAPNTGAFFFWENARNAARGEIVAGCNARANQLNLAFTNASGVVTCEEAVDDLNEVFFLRTAVLENTDCMSNPIDTDEDVGSGSPTDPTDTDTLTTMGSAGTGGGTGVDTSG
jgi:hypothetical protein